MKLTEILLEDLGHQFFFSGKKEKKVSKIDLIMNAFSPRFVPIILLRLSQSLYRNNFNTFARIFSLLNFIFFGIEIALRCEIAGGLYFPHTVGTVVGAEKIGFNAVIYHNVTIGAKEVDINYLPNHRPVIGNNVIIGSGAKILGGIKIGSNVKIGANAVVLEDLPDNVVAGGVPATVISYLS